MLAVCLPGGSPANFREGAGDVEILRSTTSDPAMVVLLVRRARRSRASGSRSPMQ